MDYKEKYEKALEWMKSIYPTMQGSDKEDAEHYFPELKEQPDPRNSIIEFIKWSCDRGSITPEQRKNVDFWLAWLEEQKPVENSGKELLYVSNKSYNIGFRDGKREAESKQEWSEEDEVYLQDALWCVEKAEKSCKDEEDKGACWSAQRWLKSLRPSWKPSEEQMYSLGSLVNGAREATKGSRAYHLKELYEQLKKL